MAARRVWLLALALGDGRGLKGPGMRRRALSSLSGALSRVGGSNSLRLRVGGVPEHFNTPWHTAAAKGLFEAAGLSVEWTDFPGGTGAMATALSDGDLDVAIGLTEGLVAAIHRGNPARLLGTYVSTPLLWGVHAHASDPSLHSMADMCESTSYAISQMGSGSHLMACVDAHARGIDPKALQLYTAGDLRGARSALESGFADVFMWEKFTTKHLVDSGEWRRIGVVPTPWPCFSIAAPEHTLAECGEALLTMLQVVRSEARALRASKECAKTIGLMYGQHEVDIVEWLDGMQWSVQPVVSHDMLSRVMHALADASLLERDELLPPAALVSHLTEDAEPGEA